MATGILTKAAAPPELSDRVAPAERGHQRADASAEPRRVWVRALACLRPFWRAALLAALAVVAGSAVGLLPPLLVRGLIDDAIPAGREAGSAGPLLPYVVALVLAPLVGCLIGLAQDRLCLTITQGFQRDLRDRLFRHLQGQSLRFFTSTPAGDVSARVCDDVEQVSAALAAVLPSIAGSLIQLVGALAILFWVSWPLALAACATVPLLLLPLRAAGPRQQKLAEEAQERHARLAALLQDVLNVGGFVLMRLFNRGEWETRRFAEQNAEALRHRRRLLEAGRWLRAIFVLVGAGGPAVVYGYGGMLVIEGRVTVGDVVAFVAYLTGLFGPVTMLAGASVRVQEMLGVFRRIFGLLDRAPEMRDEPGAARLGPVRGEIEFEGVTFAYGPDRPPALSGVSFRVRPGQLVALVGPSGSGKTTTANLLARFHDPQAGAVRIDGVDVRTVTQSSLLEQIAFVTQDAYFFHDTIRANLLYARPDASPQELEAACRAAHVHDVIVALPDGYDTAVGERGVKLSGGQRQRLAIARALLADRRVLILDEATSALDSASERLVQQALVPLTRGRTTLAIAHRLSTILAADLILVLDRGEVVESGTHAELLRRGGLYSRLFRQQFDSAGA
jgi:ATP-binding cassette subfamily B protein